MADTGSQPSSIDGRSLNMLILAMIVVFRPSMGFPRLRPPSSIDTCHDLGREKAEEARIRKVEDCRGFSRYRVTRVAVW